MAAIINLFKQCMNYLYANPVHAIILGGVILAMVITLIVIASASSKAKKKAKQAAAQAAKTAAEETTDPPVTEEVTPETVAEPVAEEPAPAPVEEPVAEEPTPAPVEEPVAEEPAPAPVEEPAQQTAANTRYTGRWMITRLISTDANGEEIESAYFFELRASNGEVLLSSEEYTSEQGAIGGIKTHKANIEKERFRISPTKKGDYIFKIMNAKNTLLCTGANYATRERCERAVESVKRFAQTAKMPEGVQELRVTAPVENDEPTPMEVPTGNAYTGKWIIYTKTDDTYGTSYYFELYASNNEKMLTSEEYTTFEGAVNGIDTHKTNIEKGNVRISLTKRGDYIFKVLSGNGQLLCLGEHYKTRSRCESAVESVKRFAQTAKVYVDKNN